MHKEDQKAIEQEEEIIGLHSSLYLEKAPV